MKRFKVIPAEVIELEFTDGKIISLVFNMKALATLGEMINNKKITLSGPEFYSAIIYAGCKAYDSEFTEDEANALYVQLSESNPEAINGIFTAYCEASGIDEKELKKKAQEMISKKKK